VQVCQCDVPIRALPAVYPERLGYVFVFIFVFFSVDCLSVQCWLLLQVLWGKRMQVRMSEQLAKSVDMVR